MTRATQKPDWLADIHAYADWWSEKGSQVEPGALVAFGIPLQSRYGKAHEIMEMLAFAQLSAQAGVAGYVESVFYDSQSCCCTVQVKPGAERRPDVIELIGDCGDRTLCQFTLGDQGTVRGREFDE